MYHLTDEDLILHFYGEGGPSEERRIDDHLAACSECRQAWTELGETLKLVDAAKVPEPGEGFERVNPDLEDVYFSTVAGHIAP